MVILYHITVLRQGAPGSPSPPPPPATSNDPLTWYPAPAADNKQSSLIPVYL